MKKFKCFAKSTDAKNLDWKWQTEEDCQECMEVVKNLAPHICEQWRDE